MPNDDVNLSEAERVCRDAAQMGEVPGQLEAATSAAVMNVAASEEAIRQAVNHRTHSGDENQPRADGSQGSSHPDHPHQLKEGTQEDIAEPMDAALKAVTGSISTVCHALGEQSDGSGSDQGEPFA